MSSPPFRVSLLLVGSLALLALAGPRAQTPTVAVVSITPNRSGDGSMSVGAKGRQFRAVNATAFVLLLNGFEFDSFRVIDAPDWTYRERFDVTAVAEHDIAPGDLRVMVRAMLADRFRLRTHVEQRQQTVYALTRMRPDGPLGPQLNPWSVDCKKFFADGGVVPPPRTSAEWRTSPPPCSYREGPGFIVAGGMTIDTLARSLASHLETPVTNRTGLAGEFEIVLRWFADSGLALDDPSLPSLFSAVREQLGLRLEVTRTPVEVLVVDHIERPTAN